MHKGPSIIISWKTLALLILLILGLITLLLPTQMFAVAEWLWNSVEKIFR